MFIHILGSWVSGIRFSGVTISRVFVLAFCGTAVTFLFCDLLGGTGINGVCGMAVIAGYFGAGDITVHIIPSLHHLYKLHD
jgi:hypothetical protein